MTLGEIRKLIDEATPGPWTLTVAENWTAAEQNCDPFYTIDAEGLKPCKENGWCGPTLMEFKHYYPTAPERVEDARLIAAARTLLPALLEVAEKARDLYAASFDCLGEPENEDDAVSQISRLNDTCAATGDALASLEALKLP